MIVGLYCSDALCYALQCLQTLSLSLRKSTTTMGKTNETDYRYRFTRVVAHPYEGRKWRIDGKLMPKTHSRVGVRLVRGPLSFCSACKYMRRGACSGMIPNDSAISNSGLVASATIHKEVGGIFDRPSCMSDRDVAVNPLQEPGDWWL